MSKSPLKLKDYAVNMFDPAALAQLDDDTDPFTHDPSVEYTATPIWREGIWPAEFIALLCHPVFTGRCVERGHGEPVLVIPGFLANDLLMLPMRQWLIRIGYQAHGAHIHWNTDCPNNTARRLTSKVIALHRETGRKVRLVGHSLGGMLAKSILQRVPELIDCVVTIGSPFQDTVKAHPAVVGVWDYLISGKGELVGRNLHPSCGSGHCMCDFVHHLLAPEPVDVPQFAIYSRRDGVVDWQSCAEHDPEMNTELAIASHIGLAFHVQCYKALAGRLAQATRIAAAKD